jgi:hypothetical protein
MTARERWRELVEQWRVSGQPAREFAAHRGIKASTLAHWKWRLGREGSSGALAAFPAMIEVRARPSHDERFEIELGASRRLRVPASFDADALRRLIAVLEEASS